MIDYNKPGQMVTDGYGSNPEDMTAPIEMTPQVSGIEAILLALRQKLLLPMLPPAPPSMAPPVGVAPGAPPEAPSQETY